MLGRMLRSGKDADQQASEEAARGVGAFLLSKPRASLLAALIGYLSLSFEILWFRAYAFLSGGSARDFAHLLAFFLAGIAFGGLAGRPLSRLADVSPTHARLVPTALLVVAAVTALVCAPGMGLVPTTVPSWVALPLVMLVAALWAALFPVIAHLSVAPDRGVGAGIGQLYLANVIGAVAGCLFTGFVLMDHLATRELTIALTVVGVAIAWVLWSDASARPKLAAAAGLAVLCVALGVVAIPLYADLYERLLYRRPVSDSKRFDHVVETKGGVAAVTREGIVYGGGVYDGRISIDFVDDVNGIFRPFSVSAFHPAPRRVLMIGLSAGAWAEVVANHPQLDELVVVEINPGYLKLIPRYPVVAGPARQPARQDRHRRRTPLAAQPSQSRLRCRDNEHDVSLALIRLERALGRVPAPRAIGAQSGRHCHVQRDRVRGGASHRGDRVPGRHALRQYDGGQPRSDPDRCRALGSRHETLFHQRHTGRRGRRGGPRGARPQ